MWLIYWPNTTPFWRLKKGRIRAFWNKSPYPFCTRPRPQAVRMRPTCPERADVTMTSSVMSSPNPTHQIRLGFDYRPDDVSNDVTIVLTRVDHDWIMFGCILTTIDRHLTVVDPRLTFLFFLYFCPFFGPVIFVYFFAYIFILNC